MSTIIVESAAPPPELDNRSDLLEIRPAGLRPGDEIVACRNEKWDRWTVWTVIEVVVDPVTTKPGVGGRQD